MVFCCLLDRAFSSFLFEIESKKQRSMSPVLESRETLKVSFKTTYLNLMLLYSSTFVYIQFPQHFTVCSSSLNEVTYSVCNTGIICTQHAYFHSTMLYGIIFWGNPTDRQKKFKMQKEGN
jgi:hypothetical protein